MTESVLTLEDILERYDYLMVQEEARFLGLVISRTKRELIDEIVTTYQTSRVNVEETASGLLSRFYYDEIKAFAKDLGLSSKGSFKDIVSRVLDSVTLEPITKYNERYCGICLKDTVQELHFNSSWKASLAICNECGHSEALGTEEQNKNVSETSINTKQELEILGVSVAIFFGLTTLSNKYVNLIISLMFGFAISVISYVVLFYAKSSLSALIMTVSHTHKHK